MTSVDSAQFKERTDAYDFDMTYYRRGLSLSPGNEQYSYFGSEFADTPGGRNLMGVRYPAIDAMIEPAADLRPARPIFWPPRRRWTGS